jgi:ParB family chromosome partitioning protein
MARQALGKGLSALIPGSTKGLKKEIAVEIKLADIIPNKNQPRENISPEELNELIKSVKEEGILQPILVKEISENKYEIIAGERRFIAAQRAGLKTIPAVIKRNISSIDQHKLALIENIQRQNLNPIEEAKAYQKLLEGYNYTQEQLSEKLGKNRATIANALRLLKLPESVQHYLITGELQPGHAKVLLSIDDVSRQKSIAELAVKKPMSVRELENYVKNMSKKREITKRTTDPELKSLEDKFKHLFGTKVNIKGSYKKGKIIIEYYNKEDFERIIDILKIK